MTAGHTQLDAISLDRFFEMSLDCMTVAGFDGYFKRLNAAWVNTLGWSFDELFSRPNIEFVHPEDRAATLASRDRLMQGRPLTGLVNRYLCKDGTHRWFDWRSIAYVEQGLVYAVARDITEQIRAEQERERIRAQLTVAERLASLGRLAAGVAHEINNPLAFMITNLRIAGEEVQLLLPEASERRQELDAMLADTLAGAERVRRIVFGLRTFSRAGEERRERISIRQVLELSLGLVSNELRQRARIVERYGETPLVLADEARLGEVFMHLLLNAFQAIDGEAKSAAEIRIATSTSEAGRAVIEIADTGAGIAPEVLGRIFDPFFTTRAVGVGTGMGLSICHNVIGSLGGEISVTSEPGKGTTFRVVLPGADPP